MESGGSSAIELVEYQAEVGIAAPQGSLAVGTPVCVGKKVFGG